MSGSAVSGEGDSNESMFGRAWSQTSNAGGITWRGMVRFALGGKQEKEYPLPKLSPSLACISAANSPE
jgi:hypothetical protein